MTVLLLGDSNGRILREAALTLDLPLLGGFIGPGRKLNTRFYTREENDIRFLDPSLDQTYRTALDSTGVTALGKLNIPVVCLFGTNLHYVSRSDIWSTYSLDPDREGQFLSSAVARALFRALIEDALTFHRLLNDWGIRTISVLPPRRFSPVEPTTMPDVFLILEEILLKELQAIGTHVIDHRHWSLDEDGNLRPEYASPLDPVHASLPYGLRIVQDIFESVQAPVLHKAD